MKYKIFVNNPWQQNTILLYDETSEAVIIDCGCFNVNENKKVEDFISENNLKLVALLSTHLHIDHILGNKFIKERYSLDAQVGEADMFLIEDAVAYAAQLGLRGVEQPPCPSSKFLSEGDIVKFGNTSLYVYEVPGHSPGSLCFYSEANKLLIVGDALFQGSIGRTDLPKGNYKDLITNIQNKLFTLPDDVVVIPGHGYSTTIGAEKKYNPFFN